MTIKLIAPGMSLRPMDSKYKRLMTPPLSLLTLAALTPKEHTIIIEDENIKRISINDRPDLVGITVNVDTAHRAYHIAEKYREKGVPVILGGIHVSANPDEAIHYADSVCIGEAENKWYGILKDLEYGTLKKKYNRGIAHPASIPIVDYSLVTKSKYLYTNITYSSRNCPFHCEFCYNSCEYTGNYRNRPITTMISEIKGLNCRHIMFIDDNFIGNISWTKKFLRRIKELKIKWNAAVSVNIGSHLDVLDEMKESGCQSLFIGFETINQWSLKEVRKNQNNIINYNKLIEEIHKREIMINASIVFGFDHDYPGVFKETLAWLVDNRIETMTAHILTPYPGTILFQKLKAQNRIIDYNWSHYNTAHVVFKPKNISGEELYRGYLWIYKKFYTFKNIFLRMPNNRQMMPYLLFNLWYRKFGKITSKLGCLGLMRRIGSLARRLAYGI